MNRILLVAPYYPPSGGGLERYVSNLAHRLHADFGWSVVVATTGGEPGDPVPVVDPGGATVYRLRTDLRVSNTPLGLRWLGQLKRIIATENVDLVNAHAPVPGIADVAARAAGRLPFVLTYHAGPMAKGRWLPDAAVWAYEKVLMHGVTRRADHVICSSEFVRTAFPRHFAAKSSIVSPGVDTDVFVPGPNGPGDDTILFVTAGLGPSARHKGLDELLQAVAVLHRTRPRLRLMIVGSATERDEFDATCQALGIADIVDLTGRLDGTDLVARFQQARVLALPSHNDSMPTVLMEAMACAVPVAASAVGGVPDLVTDGQEGLHVRPRDVDGLVDRLARLLDDRGYAVELGARGRAKVVREHGWHAKAARTRDIFTVATQRRAANRNGELDQLR